MSKIEHHKASKDELHVGIPIEEKPAIMHSWDKDGAKLSFHSPGQPQGTFEDAPPVQLLFSKEEPTTLVIGTTAKVSEAQAAQFVEVIRRWDTHDDLVKACERLLIDITTDGGRMGICGKYGEKVWRESVAIARAALAKACGE